MGTSSPIPVGEHRSSSQKDRKKRSFGRGMTEAACCAHSSMAQHPLDPLSADEIRRAVHILKSQGNIPTRSRFETVSLQEPSKDLVRRYKSGRWQRDAFICFLDPDTNRTYEAFIDLTNGKLLKTVHIPDVQPRLMVEEFLAGERAVRNDPAFKAALAKRGIYDVSNVIIDPWSAGFYPALDDDNQRLLHGYCWLKQGDKYDNAYARPIEGLCPLVNLNTDKVVRIDDYGVVPLPPLAGNFSLRYPRELRTDVRPLEIVQPEGASFSVSGQLVKWLGWEFRVGFSAREGLILHDMKMEGRPVCYRATMAEMCVPYGDPTGSHYRKNAFDVGEYGIGRLTNSLKLGCDCLGAIHYFDAVNADGAGEPVHVPNAVCMHEEDHGILWQHWDWRNNEKELRRARRLVISFTITVGNYDYSFFWYLSQDGGITAEAKLTGCINTVARPIGTASLHATEVAPGLYGIIHQHVFGFRLDMCVDGDRNTVVECDTVQVPPGPRNPYGNACELHETVLRTEGEAQRVCKSKLGRYWRVQSSHRRNIVGKPTAYRVVPGVNAMPFVQRSSSVGQRGAFMFKHLWVTQFRANELYPAGQYVNQSRGGDGLPAYAQRNANVVDEDVVLWYSLNFHHVPRVEDWPVQPMAYASFSLHPDGFFDENPTLNVPPQPAKNMCTQLAAKL